MKVEYVIMPERVLKQIRQAFAEQGVEGTHDDAIRAALLCASKEGEPWAVAKIVCLQQPPAKKE